MHWQEKVKCRKYDPERPLKKAMTCKIYFCILPPVIFCKNRYFGKTCRYCYKIYCVKVEYWRTLACAIMIGTKVFWRFDKTIDNTTKHQQHWQPYHYHHVYQYYHWQRHHNNWHCHHINWHRHHNNCHHNHWHHHYYHWHQWHHYHRYSGTTTITGTTTTATVAITDKPLARIPTPLSLWKNFDIMNPHDLTPSEIISICIVNHFQSFKNSPSTRPYNFSSLSLSLSLSLSRTHLPISYSVTWLCDFWKLMGQNFLTKIAQIFGDDFLGYFKNIILK